MDPAAEADRALVSAARRALEASWSPYSGVRVGAAIAAADGTVFTGCNVENASLGLTICAERVALVKAVSAGVRSFRALAVATDRERRLMPCGACRQFLREFAEDLPILVAGPGDDVVRTTLAELLPEAFGPDDLRS